MGQPPGLPGPGGGSDGSGGGVSTGRPPTMPSQFLPGTRGGGPPLGLPPVSVEPAVAPVPLAIGVAPVAPIALPAIVLPGGAPAGVGAPKPVTPGPAAGGGPSNPASPGRPSSAPATRAGSDTTPASTYRAGYGAYLRSAGLGEVAAVALPGFVGILLLTGAGGLIGYRQARAGRAIRAGATQRFMG